MKGDPVACYWKHATCWRKLRLMRLLGSVHGSTVRKYLGEMLKLRREDGGFSRSLEEPSSVTVTAEAIINLTRFGREKDLPTVRAATEFLWSLQKLNGSWRENPRMPQDKVPFWSSTEKGVPILTADCVEALVEAGYRGDNRVAKAVEWLRSMQTPSGLWLSLEGSDPNLPWYDVTDPDSTQRAIAALVAYGLSADTPEVGGACRALERFIMSDAKAWAETHPRYGVDRFAGWPRGRRVYN